MFDLNKLAEILINYGPYAILAVFIFYLIPSQTKLYFACNRKDTTKCRMSGLTLSLCWLVTISSVVYIFFSWSPQKTYTGSFGNHHDKYRILATNSNFFINGSPVAGQARTLVNWNYAIVSTRHEDKNNKLYTFTIEWGGGACDDENIEDCGYIDYIIPVDMLDSQLNFSSMPNQSGTLKLFYDHDNDPNTEIIEYDNYATSVKPSRNIIKNWWSAYADDYDLDKYIEGLNSSNSHVRANTRNDLRKLSKDQLEQLLRDNSLSSSARRQVERVLADLSY